MENKVKECNCSKLLDELEGIVKWNTKSRTNLKGKTELEATESIWELRALVERERGTQ